jgi:hypothetical protein
VQHAGAAIKNIEGAKAAVIAKNLVQNNPKLQTHTPQSNNAHGRLGEVQQQHPRAVAKAKSTNMAAAMLRRCIAAAGLDGWGIHS